MEYAEEEEEKMMIKGDGQEGSEIASLEGRRVIRQLTSAQLVQSYGGVATVGLSEAPKATVRYDKRPDKQLGSQRKGSIVDGESPRKAGREERENKTEKAEAEEREGERGKVKRSDERRRGRGEDQASFRYQLTADRGGGVSKREVRRCCPPSRDPLRRLH